MPETASLKLPLLVAEQAQKHVTHNEALRLLDALVKTRVVEQGLTAPPGSAAEGSIYIPGSGATGAWDEWDFNLAVSLDGAWQKIVPQVGWLVYDIDQGGYFKFEGDPTYWVEFSAGGGGGGDAADIDFAPAGNIAATDVQAAIEELDSEKLALAGGTLTGLLTVNGQIAFPASQNASANANTLDDYEEGTFTPGLTFGGGSTGITWSNQTGQYTKIGNRVLYDIREVLTSKGTSTGAALVTGLPFAAVGSVFAGSVLFANMTSGVGDTQISGVTQNAASTIPIYKQAAGTVSQLTDADFQNNSQINIAGHYRA